LGGHICRRHGYEHTMLYASPFLILYYVAFLAIGYSLIFVPVAVVAFAVQKILYWPGYHGNFATFSRGVEEGREISNMAALASFVGILAPAFGGFLAAELGYPILFVFVSAMILLSNIPMLRTPEVFEPRPFSYVDAWKRLLARENRRRFLTYFGFGEELVFMYAWPLYIMLVIPSLVTIGIVVSMAKFVNVMVMLYVGRVTDEEGDNKVSVIRSGAVYSVLSWLVRPFITGGLGVFLVDAFYRFARSSVFVPLISNFYDTAKGLGDDRVMEEIIFMEMSLGVAKVLGALTIAGIMYFWPSAWWLVFVLGAGYSSLYSLARRPSKANQ
jgi:hypothetical protein